MNASFFTPSVPDARVSDPNVPHSFTPSSPTPLDFFSNTIPLASAASSYISSLVGSRRGNNHTSSSATSKVKFGRLGSSTSRASPPPSISTNRYSPTRRSPSTLKAPSPAPFVGTSLSGWPSNSLPPSPLATPNRSNQPSFDSPPTQTDVEMHDDAYATPAKFKIYQQSTLNPSTFQLTPPDSGSYPSNDSVRPTLPSIQTLQPSTLGPLTPPLTPPYQSLTTPLPSIQLVQSPQIPLTYPTISAKLLANYYLHPLFSSQYTILEELGSGGFGFVVRASRMSDGATVAVKFIFRNKVPSHSWVNSRHWGDAPGLMTREDGKRIVPMEAYVLRNVRHQGVVAYVDLFEDDTYFYLVMEHHGTPWQTASKGPGAAANSSTMSHNLTSPSSLPALAAAVAQQRLQQQQDQMPTPSSSPTLHPSSTFPVVRPVPMARRSSCDLFECIEQHSRFSEDTAKYVFAQIVEVVYALGKMGICHRDIKDENIVIDSEFRVKLIDFGSAVIFDPTQPPPLYNRFHGTTSFASAEILRGDPYAAPSSEVWSLGVLLSILVTGETPFVDATAAAVGRFNRPKVRLGKELAELLGKCLDIRVDRRITIGEIRECAWLKEALFKKQ